jgi:hypothetical protein
MTCVHGLWCWQRNTIAWWGILVFIIPISVRADDSEKLKNRFLDEAPQAWGEYQVYAERLQGTVETTVTIKGTVKSNTRIEYKSNPHCKMVLPQSLLPRRPAGEVRAFNPLYGFSLKRKARDEPWVLTDLQMGGCCESLKTGEDFTLLRLCISTQLYELPKLVRLPNYRVVHASTTQRGGIELCQIDFKSGQTDGILLLDPNRFWTVHHCTIREQSSDQVIVAKHDMEVRDPTAKYPIPKRWTLYKELTDPKNGKRDAEVVIEFDLKEVSTPPDDKEFTLSAFGLREPMGVKSPDPPRTWLWLLAAALAAAALASLFAWLKRRRSRAASGPSPAS